MVEHPDWNDIKRADELLKEVIGGEHPNLHTTTQARAGHDEKEVEDMLELFIPMERGFMECRDCGKTIGVSIALAGTDMDFECINCYNDGVKDEM